MDSSRGREGIENVTQREVCTSALISRKTRVLAGTKELLPAPTHRCLPNLVLAFFEPMLFLDFAVPIELLRCVVDRPRALQRFPAILRRAPRELVQHGSVSLLFIPPGPGEVNGGGDNLDDNFNTKDAVLLCLISTK